MSKPTLPPTPARNRYTVTLPQNLSDFVTDLARKHHTTPSTILTAMASVATMMVWIDPDTKPILINNIRAYAAYIDEATR